MRDALILFAAGYASVFLLGFQSRNVNHGNFRLAAATSFCVALAQAKLIAFISAAGGGWTASAIYGVAGSCGIVSSMWTHRRLVSRQRKAVLHADLALASALDCLQRLIWAAEGRDLGDGTYVEEAKAKLRGAVASFGRHQDQRL